MARQPIDLTTPQPNGKMGEPTKSAWEKVNEMTLELYDGINSSYKELGYAERTTDFAVAAGSIIDVPGLSVTADVSLGPIVINFGGTLVIDSPPNYANLVLYIDGVQSSQLLASGSGAYTVVSRCVRIPSFASPGTHTFKLALQSTGGAAAVLAGQNVDRPYIQVVNL